MSFSDTEDFIKEIRKKFPEYEEFYFVQDKDESSCNETYYEMELYGEREETPEEYEKRVNKESNLKKKQEENDWRSFLYLKEKFKDRIQEEKS